MIETCKNYLPNLATTSGITNFPTDFYSLLITPPEKIAEIYAYYKTRQNFQYTIDTEFKKSVVQTDSKGNPIFDKDGNPKTKEKYILDYEYRDYSKAIADFFIKHEEKGTIRISTCFYCNMTYIKSFDYIGKGKIKETRRVYELDHFIPKSKCSLFALSLYNFVPSCKNCNHLKLDDVDFSNLSPSELEKLFPSAKCYDHDSSLKFRINESNQANFPPLSFVKDGLGNDIRKNIYIHLKKRNSDSDSYEENEAELFHILERYEPHKNEFLNYMEKHLKYPSSFFALLYKSLTQEQVNSLESDIFDKEIRNSENQIFQKIYKDFDEQF